MGGGTGTSNVSMQRWDDLFIALSYFSIPIQFAIVSYKHSFYSKLIQDSLRQRHNHWNNRSGNNNNNNNNNNTVRASILLLLLFALFLCLCGTSHLLRFCGIDHSYLSFQIIHGCTAIVSIATAFFLVPTIDGIFQQYSHQVALENDAKRKLMEFMNFLCHEIRNPLFAITSTIAFLEPSSEATPDEYEAALTCVQQSSNLMLRVVNDVLDISKIESGDLKLEWHCIDIRALLYGAVRSIESQLLARNNNNNNNDTTPTTASPSSSVQLDLTVSPMFPPVIQTDSVRLLQIAYNLLSNAAKFSREGFIHIRVDTISIESAIAQGWIVNLPGTKKKKSTNRKNNKKNNSNETFNSSFILQKDPSTFLFSNLSEYDDNDDDDNTNYFNSDNGQSNEGNDDDRLQNSEEGVPSSSSLQFSDFKNNKNKNKNTGNTNSDDDDDDDWVALKLQVQDTGIGMSPELVKSIRAPFSNSKLSQYRSQGGTGLGLTILDRLTYRMGGKMHVTSALGKGSTFTVYIPVKVVMPILEDYEVQLADGETTTSTASIQHHRHYNHNQQTLHDTHRAEKEAQDALSQSLRMSGILSKAMESLDTSLRSQQSQQQYQHHNSSLDSRLMMSGSSILEEDENDNDDNATLSTVDSSPATLNSPLFDISKTIAMTTPSLPPTSLAGPPPPPPAAADSPTTTTSKNSIGTAPKPLFQIDSSTSSTATTTDNTKMPQQQQQEQPTQVPSPPPPAPKVSPTFRPPNRTPSLSKASQRKKINSTTPTTEPPITFDFAPGEKVVLVVDDNAMNRKFFGRMLTQLKIEPAYATQGQEAVDYMTSSRNLNPTNASAPMVGMILMDWSMPVMDGCEAIRQIRNRLGLKHVPIVAVTACAAEAPKEELLGAGADEFATKPLLRADLVQKCKRYLLNKNKNKNGTNLNKNKNNKNNEKDQKPNGSKGMMVTTTTTTTTAAASNGSQQRLR